MKQLDRGEEYDIIRAVVESYVPVALSPKEIEEASYADEELCVVKNCVKSGNWEQCTIPSYAHVKDELCTYGEFLLRGTRIVVPKVLRDKVVILAHEGHQGVVKTKYRLRSKVWWPGMDKDARFGMAVKLLQVVTHLIRCLLFCLQVPLGKIAVQIC